MVHQEKTITEINYTNQFQIGMENKQNELDKKKYYTLIIVQVNVVQVYRIVYHVVLLFDLFIMSKSIQALNVLYQHLNQQYQILSKV